MSIVKYGTPPEQVAASAERCSEIILDEAAAKWPGLKPGVPTPSEDDLKRLADKIIKRHTNDLPR